MDALHDKRRNPAHFVVVGCTAVLVLVTTTVWSKAAKRGMEYDELWTLYRYAHAPSVQEIFSGLETPNNHPLHSLLVRLTTRLLGDSELAVRLPALAAGTLLFICVPFAVYYLTRRWETVLLATAWIASNVPLLHFAQTARGYSLQALLLFAYAVLVLGTQQERAHERLRLAATVTLGTAAMLVLSTSVLFLAPVALADVVARAWRWWKQRSQQSTRFLVSERWAVTAHTVLALLCAGWIMRNAVGLEQARGRFGADISSVPQWFRFCGEVIGGLELWPVTVLAALGLMLWADRTQWTLMVAVFTPLLAAAILGAGPVRAYLPIVPLICVAAAVGLCRALDALVRKTGEQFRWVVVSTAAVLPLLILPAALRSGSTPDWKVLAGIVRDVAGPKACIIYPSYESYVVWHYLSPETMLDSLDRLPSNSVSTLILTEDGGRMTGVDIAAGRSGSIVCPARLRVSIRRVPGTSLELASYPLAALPSKIAPEMIETQSVYFLQLGPVDSPSAHRLLEELFVESGRDQWLLLNPHLRLARIQSDITVQAFLLATTNASALLQQSTNAMSSSSATFYQLVSPGSSQ